MPAWLDTLLTALLGLAALGWGVACWSAIAVAAGTMPGPGAGAAEDEPG